MWIVVYKKEDSGRFDPLIQALKKKDFSNCKLFFLKIIEVLKKAGEDGVKFVELETGREVRLAKKNWSIEVFPAIFKLDGTVISELHYSDEIFTGDDLDAFF